MSEEAKNINKSDIKSFAIEARNILIKSATTEAGLYGISEDEIRTPIQKGPDFEVYETLAGTEKRIYRADMRRRENLVKAIQEKGFQEVIEETAYTWFNRLIAIRFMEVNDYLPTRTRVLSSETGNNTPDLINDFLDVDLGMTNEELQAVQSAKNENRYDDAFRLLFIKECNALNDILPGLFEKTDDYMELLLNMPYTSDGVVRMLIDTIPEKNFDVEKEGQIEIIGWLYQYYNTEPKAKAFGKKGKITKEEIPAVTQLFTPDWIVRYMVENSLGRLWLEGHPDESLRSNWRYYQVEVQQNQKKTPEQEKVIDEYRKLSPEDIKVIDPCMGSGHVLIYIFDILMQIYKNEGYTERDAAKLILEKNLYGLDIDDRAYQLAYFAVMMKARQYNRNILKAHPYVNVYAVQESNYINRNHLKYLGKGLSEIEKNNAINQINGLLDAYFDAKEYGALITLEKYDWDLLERFIEKENSEGQLTFETIGIESTQRRLKEIIEIGRIMTTKFNVVVSNPPYMNPSAGSEALNKYVKKNYPDSKTDLFAVFIERDLSYTIKNGYLAMITQHSWMFLSSYMNLRKKICNHELVSMAHLGARAFEEISGEVVQTTAFTIRNAISKDYIGEYSRLIEYSSQDSKRDAFLEGNDRYYSNQSNYQYIPGMPIAYWTSDDVIDVFKKAEPASSYAVFKHGMSTGKNEAVVRLWQEVDITKIATGMRSHEEFYATGKRFVPYNKGGEYRKWYGNQTHVLGYDLAYDKLMDTFDGHRHDNKDSYFKESIAWSKVTMSGLAMRYFPEGFVYDVAGCSAFMDHKYLKYLLAFFNSKIKDVTVSAMSPTLNFEVGQLRNAPIIFREDYLDQINILVDRCIALSKEDWDSFETSWNFKRHPLIKGYKKISEAFEAWTKECSERKQAIKVCEEEINQIFIDIYDLSNELTPEVDISEITTVDADFERDIRQLISYSVGCMLGRYSLDEDGIVFAGGKYDSDKYKCFHPDNDAIIPITDEDYGFDDDIVNRFVDFIQTSFGGEYLDENLTFIASALSNKDDDPKKIIREYFENEFFKDHCSMCSVTGSGKRPIYWLFDSGKQNGFKALIYVHRYNPDTVGLIRSTYLHKVQSAIENSLQNAEYVISTSSSATEKAAASKKRDKYVKQLNELRPYYQALSHVALKRIDMDLDNGVKANYQLFQGVEISTEGKKKQKIDLLARI